jgi:redox-sensitive bicupin YhaK (pirin superfamily)
MRDCVKTYSGTTGSYLKADEMADKHMLSRTVSFALICFLPVYIICLVNWFPQYTTLFSQTLSSKLRASSAFIATSRGFWRTFNTTISTTNVTRAAMPSVNLIPRLSQERGHADHDWLKTFHTFSFAMYQDSKHSQYGCLRVINEDRVAPKTGFGTHSHREFEIFSYIVSGELEHKDSMGNTEILKRGDLQMTSTGTGISHSEHQHGPKEVHFLQIWSLPSQSRLPPKYYTRHFTDEEKKDVFLRVVAPVNDQGVKDVRESDGPAPVHSPLSLYATLISPSTTLIHTFQQTGKSRKGYIHVIQKSGYNPGPSEGARVKVSGAGEEGKDIVLREGDGAYIQAEDGAKLQVQNVGEGVAEVLLFDME